MTVARIGFAYNPTMDAAASRKNRSEAVFIIISYHFDFRCKTKKFFMVFPYGFVTSATMQLTDKPVAVSWPGRCATTGALSRWNARTLVR